MRITIDNEARELKYNFRAMKRLGLKGPADTEGIGKVMQDAANSWAGLSRLISAGLGLVLADEHPDIDEFVGDLDYGSMVELITGIGQAMGVTASVAPAEEGEQSGPPAQSSNGMSVEQSPGSTTA